MNEIVVNIVTAVCFALLTVFVLYVVVNLLTRKRADSIAFVRSFKKGKCAFIYLAAIPLYTLALMYEGRGFLPAVFESINEIINLVVLKYDVSVVETLLDANLFYSITIYYCYVLIALNAVMFTLSLTSQNIWRWAQSMRAFFTGKQRLVILGFNDESKAVYKSDKKDEFVKTLVGEMSPEDGVKLYAEKTAFEKAKPEDYVKKLFPHMIKRKNKKFVIVVNTKDEDKNIAVCQSCVSFMRALSTDDRNSMFRRVQIYVFGDERYETVYTDIMSASHGCIRYVNRYLVAAINFIDRYPLSRFLGSDRVDYKTGLVKKDVGINVCMLGFGKCNRRIFLTSVANNQFLTSGKNSLEIKPVRYVIFDKCHAESNKNLNHSYYRFRNECADFKQKDYLPLPVQPAEEDYRELDINHPDFYKSIKEAVSGEKDMNFIIVAFGSDLENIDMAQKLCEKRKEWELDNLVIFVKANNAFKDDFMPDVKDCYFIANDSEVYDIGEIMGDKISRMARMRNEIYSLQAALSKGEKLTEELIAKNRAATEEKWFVKLSQHQRESNLYCCLSLRSKLNLMGLDYCPVSDKREGLSENEYLDIYAAGDMPEMSSVGDAVFGKKTIVYPLEFKKSLRGNLAEHEHERWNSFMISRGMIPASKQQILTEKDADGEFTNGKNYELRRHGNITTFEGLKEFRKMLASRDGVDEKQKDVIKYDYQLLDDAVWLLTACKYKIVHADL